MPTITLGCLARSGQIFPEFALIGGLIYIKPIGGTDPVLHALICDSSQHSTPVNVNVHSLKCAGFMFDFFPIFLVGMHPARFAES